MNDPKYLDKPPIQNPDYSYACPSFACDNSGKLVPDKVGELRDAEEFSCPNCGARYRKYSMSLDWEVLRPGVFMR